MSGRISDPDDAAGYSPASRSPMRPLALVGSALSAAALMLAGCFGDGRSAAAVCKVWDSEGLALHDRFERSADVAANDPLGALVNIGTAPGRLADLMDHMAAVAPSGVEPSFSQLADAMRQSLQNGAGNVGNPLAGLASGLATAFNSAGAAETVNGFLAEHCGIPG